MQTSTRQVDTVTIVDISGRIDGEKSAAVRNLVCDLLRGGHKQILINLGDVHFIDSWGLGTLFSCLNSVRKQGGKLKLLNVTNHVRDVMKHTNLYAVFDIADDEAAAVKSFSQSTAATA